MCFLFFKEQFALLAGIFQFFERVFRFQDNDMTVVLLDLLDVLCIKFPTEFQFRRKFAFNVIVWLRNRPARPGVSSLSLVCLYDNAVLRFGRLFRWGRLLR